MSTGQNVDISDDIRKKLGDYINSKRVERELGFNQLSLKSGLNARTLNEIINGKSKRTNPFHLQRLGYALRIDYKELYKIVGYLSEDDFYESTLLRKEIDDLKNKLNQLESMNLIHKSGNSKDIILENCIFIKNENNKELIEELCSLSEVEKEKILIFIKEFIKK